ncbi:MAG: ABC transporter ATP-binding protein [Bacteroidota bacterium]|nr:ABC transporter ATP-binding protein [Bacteroidota bacterium]
MNNQTLLLRARALRVGYSSTVVAGPLDVDLFEGRLICLLGPNGSGKSTLLRTLAGLQPPLGGKLEIDGATAARLSPPELARKISLVLTDPVRNSNLTAKALVSLGRYPYSGWLGTLGEADLTVIEWAMKAAGVSSFQQRKLITLSDGESQKVMLARALAQDTPLMMLDEPTAHLDLPSRIQLMQLLHQLVRRTRKGILVSTHELDLALQVADEIWLLRDKGGFDRGAPEDLVLTGVFGEAFYKEGIRFDTSSGTFHIDQEQGPRVRLIARGAPAAAAAFWTKRALGRYGFTVVEGKETTEETVHSITVTAGAEAGVEAEARAALRAEGRAESGEIATA